VDLRRASTSSRRVPIPVPASVPLPDSPRLHIFRSGLIHRAPRWRRAGALGDLPVRSPTTGSLRRARHESAIAAMGDCLL